MRKIYFYILIISFSYADLNKPSLGENLRYIHILFEWDQEPDAIAYNLQASTNQSFSNIILNNEGAKLIYATSHNEEGARFWKKTNVNLILLLDDPENKATKKPNYIWASLTQIKRLSLIDNIVNPFVKTILFMI